MIAEEKREAAYEAFRAAHAPADRERWFMLAEKMIYGIMADPVSMFDIQRLGQRMEEGIRLAVGAALAKEREACAKVAEAWYESFTPMSTGAIQKRIAETIRARGC